MSSIFNAFRVTWSIEMFCIDVLKGDVPLESGFFRIESLKNTRWNLRLFREGIGKEDWIMCDLKNGSGFSDYETVYLNYCLHIKVENQKYFEKVGCFIESGPGSFHRIPFILTRSLNYKHYPNDTLTLVCEIMPYQEKGDADNLECLSKDASKLYTNKLFTDVALYTDDHQVFEAHKFILFYRWKESKSWLNKTQKEMKVNSVSGPVFERFLRYLYCGVLPENDISPELFNFIFKNCEDLTRNLRTLSHELSMRTPMHTTRSVLKWCFKDFISSGLESLPFFRVLRMGHPYTPELLVNVDKAVDITGETYLDISFCVSRCEHHHYVVFLRCHACTIPLVQSVNHDPSKMTAKHVFYDDEDWHFPPRLKMADLAKMSSFQLVLILDIGHYHSPPIVETRTEFRTGSRGVKNLRALARDFKQAAIDSRYKDFILETETNVLHLHRAMLSARSDVFRKILERSNASDGIQTMNISPIHSGLMMYFVEYVYWGSISHLSVDEVNELMGWSEEFHMPKLEEFCEEFLACHSKRSRMW